MAATATFDIDESYRLDVAMVFREEYGNRQKHVRVCLIYIETMVAYHQNIHFVLLLIIAAITLLLLLIHYIINIVAVRFIELNSFSNLPNCNWCEAKTEKGENENSENKLPFILCFYSICLLLLSADNIGSFAASAIRTYVTETIL